MMTVPSIESGRGELAKLMADHVLSDKNRDMLPAVVHCNSVPYHQREDSRAAGPTLDDPFFALCIHIFYFLKEFGVRIWPLFQ